MNQQGVTFLEIVVVIAILMITSALVAPSIQDWRQKRALENDFLSVLAQIDYLKARARTLNGTALLVCTGQGGTGSLLTYQVSTNPQIQTNTVLGGFGSGVVEDPVAKNASFNILSGKTKIVSNLCNAGTRGVFIASGQTGLEGTGAQIDLKIGPQIANANLKDYRVLVNQSTGFIQKYKGSITNDTWTEIDK
jgi:Tfp pilus assembly protein FimT